MIGNILQVDLEELIRANRIDELRRALAELDESDVAELIIDLPDEDEGIVFRVLERGRASEVFSHLPLEHQEELLQSLSSEQTTSLLGHMSPDDRTHLLDELPAEVTRRLLERLSPEQLKTTRALLGYPEESAGRYMTPYYVALRPDATVAEALQAIRRSPARIETLNVLYVVDGSGKLLDDVRLATLVKADPAAKVEDLHDRVLVSVPVMTDREELVRLFEKYDRAVLPVVDAHGMMLGIITVDDVMDVAEAETTEDIHRFGGVEALDMPYMSTSIWELVRKRGTWLSVIFLGEMLTATAMGYFQDELSRTVVLSMFLPLIISSGGNSGSQASTLVIRAMALGEVKLGHWWRVFCRELACGVMLGLLLCVIALVRIHLWQWLGWQDYTIHHGGEIAGVNLVALSVGLALVGVVLWGTLMGAMMPLLLRLVRLDPATISAPLIATLVDVTGLIIYLSVALAVLHNVLR